MRSGSPHAAIDARVQLAGVADDGCHPISSSAQRPGCQGARSAARTSRVDARGPRDDPRRLDGVGPRRGAPAPHQPARPRGAAEHRGQVLRLGRQHGVESGQLLVARTGGDAGQFDRLAALATAGTPDPASNSARSRLPRPTLRSTVASSPGSSDVRSSGSSSEIGFTSRSACRRGSSAGSPNESCTDGGDERVRRAPRRTRPTRRRARRAVAGLPRGEAAPGRGRRQHRRQRLVADQPHDLLDEVGRRRAGPDATSAAATCSTSSDADDDAADSLEMGHDAVPRDRHPGDRRRQPRPAGRSVAGAATDADHGVTLDGGRAAVLDQQLDAAAERDRRDRRGRRRARSAWPPRWAACAGGRCARSATGPSARPRARRRRCCRRSRCSRRPSRRRARSRRCRR